MGKTKSQKQERKWAKAMGGRAIPGSGNTPVWKGDVDSDRERKRAWKLECKTTKRNTYTLSHQDLCKIENHAKKVGRLPAFIVAFRDDDKLGGGEFVVIRKEDFSAKDKEKLSYIIDRYPMGTIKDRIRFVLEELNDCWLNDKLIELSMMGKKYIILNELDFRRITDEDIIHRG